MASRREVTIRDRQRNSTARKNTHRKKIEREKQQAAVFQKLWSQAKEENRAKEEARAGA